MLKSLTKLAVPSCTVKAGETENVDPLPAAYSASISSQDGSTQLQGDSCYHLNSDPECIL